MKKSELVYREVLRSFLEEKKAKFTQLELAKALQVSLSTVNNALRPLRRMGAIKVKRRSFEFVNARKIIYYWASIRNMEKEVIYKTTVEMKGAVAGIEKEMPPSVVFAAYTAYKFRFNDAAADYSEVYVYCGSNDLGEIKKRFQLKSARARFPNLFVLRKDFADNFMPLAHIFVDLWNLKEWYAWDFVKALDEKLF